MFDWLRKKRRDAPPAHGNVHVEGEERRPLDPAKAAELAGRAEAARSRLALAALLAISACEGGSGGGPDGGAPDDGGSSGDGGSPRLCMVVTTSPACVEAETMPAVTLGWIERNIFTPNCGGASCHGVPTGGGPPLGRLALTTGSHSKLVNVDSTFAMGRKLVVPSDVPKSYLLVMLRAISLTQADPAPAPEPSGGRYMPLGSPPICCQKLDAIGRWITAGALNN